MGCLGLFLTCLLPLQASARLSCVTFLGPSTQSLGSQLTERRVSLSEKRKALETEVFKSYGTLTPSLDKALYAVFERPQNPNLQVAAAKALKASPLTAKMNVTTRAKILSLVQRRAVRPYMAILIGRYIEQLEFKQGFFSDKALNSITEIVTLFITEKALIESQKTFLTHNDKANEKEILDFLEGRVRYSPHSVNYNRPSGRLILSNLVLGHIQTIESMIAQNPWPQEYKIHQ
ncbi:MAG: hypothetical protein M9899_04165 [Bdellovibrionaceae bacterium]|nr:hypothetical protein [Pseudobdellovibrionaceae bacterium]